MYHNGQLHIPKSDAVCRQVMKMGKETIEGTWEMFAVCTTLWLVNSPADKSFVTRNWMARSAYPLTHGPQAMDMHF